jgi:glycine oxidase
MGLGIAWQLARAGCPVTVFERDEAGRGATWASAGMLSPLTEAQLVERELVELGLASARMYPEWVRELEGESGTAIGYRTDGALKVALDPDDAREVEHLFETQRQLGLEVEWLSGRQARRIEPLLSPRVTAAIACAADHQVDNRRMVQALVGALARAGGQLRERAPVARLELTGGRVEGVWVGQLLHRSDAVVLAAGAWSAQVDGLPDALRPPVRPVRGQMVAVQMDEDVRLGKVIWAPDAYLVPKADGRLLLGSTTEEKGFDQRLTAGGMLDILRGAWEAVPGVYDLPVLETWAGLRPGSRDNAPVLGATPVEGLFMATGHFRKGILLAPATARHLTSLILTGRTPAAIASFGIGRFTKA